MLRGPSCRALPFSDDLFLPATERGPVECSQGRCSSADRRSRSRPRAERPVRFARLSLPAATRLGFFGLDIGSENGRIVETLLLSSLSCFPRPVFEGECDPGEDETAGILALPRTSAESGRRSPSRTTFTGDP